VILTEHIVRRDVPVEISTTKPSPSIP